MSGAPRHAVVTGSSAGIGAAIARRLLADGWRVTGLDKSPPTIMGRAFSGRVVDLTDAQRRSGTIAEIGPADALVHASGVMRGGALGSLDPDVGEHLWRINVDAAAALANALVPRMERGGRVVLIGSRASHGVAQRSQYAAAKAALVALARSWAVEVAGRGITVNVVAPAATETGMLKDPARADVPPRMPPIGRYITPEEIAALVAFLLSAEAGAITGQEIMVCGGASL